MNKLIRNISRHLIGLLFLFSGFAKAVDPMGSKFKFDDYFVAFGMEWLIPFSLILGIILSTVEFSVGFCLISNLYSKICSIIGLIFMLFFTGLTFILALTNPVTDCGCFGDAVVLTNWQTFFKNLIFLVPTVIIFVERKKFVGRFDYKWQIVLTSLMLVTIVSISIYSLNNLPIVDYRPYRVGQNLLLNSKEHPNGAPSAEFETTLIYRKDGIEKTFDLDNLPDSTWEWVETNNKLIKEGYVPPVSNFSLIDDYGMDNTSTLLNRNEMVLMANVLDLSKLSQEEIERYNEISVQCLSNDIYFTMLTSTDQGFIEDYKNQYLPTYKIFTVDPITLKTIVRSDGGFMLTYKGTVLKKWHRDKFPDVLSLNEYLMIKEAQQSGSPRPMQLTAYYLLIFLSIALLFELFGLNLKSREK
ncbi:MAG TPA: hypothetical protein PLS84_02895 [Salinivirgaceae bacterium]|nr:hypothetical protein [Salinivirgaceae bacterium]